MSNEIQITEVFFLNTSVNRIRIDQVILDVFAAVANWRVELFNDAGFVLVTTIQLTPEEYTAWVGDDVEYIETLTLEKLNLVKADPEP